MLRCCFGHAGSTRQTGACAEEGGPVGRSVNAKDPANESAPALEVKLGSASQTSRGERIQPLASASTQTSTIATLQAEILFLICELQAGLCGLPEGDRCQGLVQCLCAGLGPGSLVRLYGVTQSGGSPALVLLTGAEFKGISDAVGAWLEINTDVAEEDLGFSGLDPSCQLLLKAAISKEPALSPPAGPGPPTATTRPATLAAALPLGASPAACCCPCCAGPAGPQPSLPAAVLWLSADPARCGPVTAALLSSPAALRQLSAAAARALLPSASSNDDRGPLVLAGPGPGPGPARAGAAGPAGIPASVAASAGAAPSTLLMRTPSAACWLGWMSGCLRRMSGAVTLQAVVAEVTAAVELHVRRRYMLDFSVHAALVPTATSYVGYMLDVGSTCRANGTAGYGNSVPQVPDYWSRGSLEMDAPALYGTGRTSSLQRMTNLHEHPSRQLPATGGLPAVNEARLLGPASPRNRSTTFRAPSASDAVPPHMSGPTRGPAAAAARAALVAGPAGPKAPGPEFDPISLFAFGAPTSSGGQADVACGPASLRAVPRATPDRAPLGSGARGDTGSTGGGVVMPRNVSAAAGLCLAGARGAGDAQRGPGLPLPPAPPLRAKAFPLTHTLLGQLAEADRVGVYGGCGSSRTASLGNPVTSAAGVTAFSTAALAHSAAIHPVGVGAASGAANAASAVVVSGTVIPRCGAFVQDVSQPSRDVCLVMAAASTAGAGGGGSTSRNLHQMSGQLYSGGGGGGLSGASGGADVASSSLGAQSLVLVGLGLGPGGTAAGGAASGGNGGGGGRGGGGFLGLYLAFPAQLPARLLDSIRESCGQLLREVLGPPLLRALSGRLAPQLATLAAGVPGSYALVPPTPSLMATCPGLLASGYGSSAFSTAAAVAAASSSVAPAAAAVASGAVSVKTRRAASSVAASTAADAAAAAASSGRGGGGAMAPLAVLQRSVGGGGGDGREGGPPSGVSILGEVRPPGRLARTTTLTQLEGDGALSSHSHTFDHALLETPPAAGLQPDAATAVTAAGRARRDAAAEAALVQDLGGPSVSSLRRGMWLRAGSSGQVCARGGSGSSAAGPGLPPLLTSGSFSNAGPAAGLAAVAAEGAFGSAATLPAPPSAHNALTEPYQASRRCSTMAAAEDLGFMSTSWGLAEAADVMLVTGPSGPLHNPVLTLQQADGSSSMQAHLGLLVDSITGTMRMAAAEAAAASSTASMVGDRLGHHQAPNSTRARAQAQAQGSPTAIPGPGLPSGVQSSGARLDRVPGMDDMEELRLYDVIGEGAGGAVFRGTLGTVPVAVKLMEVPALDEQDERDEQEAAAERQAIEMLLSTGGGGAEAGPGAAHAACAAADDISGEWEAALASEAEARDAETRAEAAAARHAKALRRRESAHLSAKRALYRNAMELAVLCSTAHVNIVQCHAVYDSVVLARGEEFGPQGMPGIVLRRSRGKAVNGGSPVCTAIVTELCDSSLAAVLEGRTFPPGLAVGRQRVMDMRAVYMTLLEIALALRHLHSRRLVHRDVKPANVLLKHCSTDPRGWTSKLADFGFALVLDRQENTVASSAQHSGYASSSRNADPGAASGAACSSGASGLARSGVGSSSLGSGASGAAPSSGNSGVDPCCCYYTVQDSACGTITHIAPEATQPNSRVDASVDVYALGIIMWELVAGRGSRPYKDLRSGAILNAVASGVRPVFPESVPQAYRDLAHACWVADPQRRPSAAEVVALLKAQYARCSAAAARAQQQAAEASAAAAASASTASSRPCDR